MSDLDFQTLRQVLSYRLHGVLTLQPVILSLATDHILSVWSCLPLRLMLPTALLQVLGALSPTEKGASRVLRWLGPEGEFPANLAEGKQ